MSLPAEFVSLMERIGLSDLPGALASTEPSVSVRLNPLRPSPDMPDGCEPVGWCDGGWYLPARPSFTLDPAFHQGRYYVQEAASMFHAHIVRSLCPAGSSPLRVLDACAAPGGKTTAVISALPPGSMVVANEYVPARAAILRENIIKWGSPDVMVSRGDTESLSRLRGMFDLVIADVPCSGEGMMRKDPEAVAQWSPALVAECAARQREIVGNLWETLRPGGYMVYSTCTFNRSENEEMIDYIVDSLGGECVEIPVEPSWGISGGLSTPHPCQRFIPGRTRGEGLFVSVIRKPGSAPARDPGRKKVGKSRPAAIPQGIGSWIDTHGGAYTVRLTADRVSAFPSAHLPLLEAVAGVVDVIHEGVTLGVVKGRDVVPSQSLALSALLRAEAFPQVEVDRPTALRYLHGESPVLPPDTPRGFVLLTWQGSPLGFVKNLGNRSNSLYPSTWRIRQNI